MVAPVILNNRMNIQQNGLSISSNTRAWFESQVADAEVRGAFAVRVMCDATLAAFLLARNVGNRKFNRERWSGYLRMMINGEWQFNGDQIRVSRRGRVLDGQHRLAAIQSFGKPVEVMLLFGIDDDVKTVSTIDQGGPRQNSVILQQGVRQINANLAGAGIRCAFFGYGMQERKTFAPELLQIREALIDAVDFAIPLFGRAERAVRSGVVVGVIIRAFYHETQQRLAEFVDVMYTLKTPRGEADEAALQMYRACKNEKSVGSMATRRNLYRRGINAVHHFCRESSPVRLVEAKRELYPFPEQVLAKMPKLEIGSSTVAPESKSLRGDDSLLFG